MNDDTKSKKYFTRVMYKFGGLNFMSLIPRNTSKATNKLDRM